MGYPALATSSFASAAAFNVYPSLATSSFLGVAYPALATSTFLSLTGGTMTGGLTMTNATTTNLAINGQLSDWLGLPGTNGQVLSSTGTSTKWITNTVTETDPIFVAYPALATSSFLGIGYPSLATSSFLGVAYPALATSTFLSLTGGTMTGGLIMTNATTTNFAIAGQLSDWLGLPGSSGQVLSSTGTSTKWITNTVTETDPFFVAYPALATSSFLGVAYPALATSSFLGVSYPSLATSSFLGVAYPSLATSSFLGVAYPALATSTFLSLTGGTMTGGLTMTNATTTNFYVSAWANLVTTTIGPAGTAFTDTSAETLDVVGSFGVENPIGTDIFMVNAFGSSITSTVLFVASGGLTVSSTLTFATATGTSVTSTNFWSNQSIIATLLKIPNSATLLTVSLGEIGIDTTSNQLRYYGTATTTLTPYRDASFAVPSSTLNLTGTTTIPLGLAMRGETWQNIACFNTSTGGTRATSSIQFGDGTNWMTTYTVTSSANVPIVAVATNNAFIAGEPRYAKIWANTGTFDMMSCTIEKYINAD